MANQAARDLTAQVSSLLSDAQTAHSKYEREVLGGKHDEAWPDWYAAFLIDNRLPALLGGEADQQEFSTRLPKLLAQADKQYQEASPPQSWQDYYARYIVGMARGQEGV